MKTIFGLVKKVAAATAVVAVLTITVFSAESLKLNVGDPAPELTIAKWFKGDPVEKLEADKVYVVEFWATWCGPCRVSVPHLTELAHKFKGKVQVMGISVFERAKDDAERFAAIEKFIQGMGDKMDYSVGADVSEGSMGKNWMNAAGETGIPSAFIVGKDGKVAWIGHPMSGLDKVLEDVLAGKHDVKAAAETRLKAKEAQLAEREVYARLNALRKDGKNKEALELIDKTLADNPALASRMAMYRLNLLFEEDEAAAVKEARKLAEGEWKDNARGLSTLAGMLVNPRRKAPDYELAIELGKKACDLSSNQDPLILTYLADAYFGNKDVKKAIETQQMAIKAAGNQTGGTASASMKQYLQSKLDRYQKAGEEKKSDK